jgi:hypothetical protein
MCQEEKFSVLAAVMLLAGYFEGLFVGSLQVGKVQSDCVLSNWHVILCKACGILQWN